MLIFFIARSGWWGSAELVSERNGAGGRSEGRGGGLIDRKETEGEEICFGLAADWADQADKNFVDDACVQAFLEQEAIFIAGSTDSPHTRTTADDSVPFAHI